MDEHRFDRGSLVEALAAAQDAVEHGEIVPAERAQRLDERRRLDLAHYHLYRELLR
jgi:hypothetical protein